MYFSSCSIGIRAQYLVWTPNTVRGKILYNWVKKNTIFSHDNESTSNGCNISRSPLFKRKNFDYWKDKMQAFYMSNNLESWDIVKEEYTRPKMMLGWKYQEIVWLLNKSNNSIWIPTQGTIWCALSTKNNMTCVARIPHQ